MLPRVLEPEVMDAAGDALDYDQMDHVAVNQSFAADFLSGWSGANPILDAGSGTAQIPIEICRRDARPAITVVDLSAEMLRLARANVARAGLASRIKIQFADAKTLPFNVAAFAAVVSNSIVHHMADPSTVIAEMVRVCRRGGRMFVRDLLRPSDSVDLRRLVDQYAAGANERQRQLFGDSLHAALTLAEIRSLVSPFGFAEESVQQTSDRHWTWIAIR